MGPQARIEGVLAKPLIFAGRKILNMLGNRRYAFSKSGVT
jgi:hypothetical protein